MKVQFLSHSTSKINIATILHDKSKPTLIANLTEIMKKEKQAKEDQYANDWMAISNDKEEQSCTGIIRAMLKFTQQDSGLSIINQPTALQPRSSTSKVLYGIKFQGFNRQILNNLFSIQYRNNSNLSFARLNTLSTTPSSKELETVFNNINQQIDKHKQSHEAIIGIVTDIGLRNHDTAQQFSKFLKNIASKPIISSLTVLADCNGGANLIPHFSQKK